MNKYNLKKSEYYTIRACELNEIIDKVYGVKNFECSLEASSNLSTTHDISQSMIFLHDQQLLSDILKECSCDTDQVSLILLDLFLKKEIPEGNYIVDHSW